MKKIKFLFLTFAVLITMAFSVQAQPWTCGANLTASFSNDTLYINGSGAMTNYVSASATPWYGQIPAGTKLVIGDSVTSIGEYAFRDCINLTGNLIIPDSVKIIGDYAFYNCRFIGSLNIPNWVTTIGNFAFMNCNFFSGNLTIGNSVTTIGNNVFQSCSGFNGNLTIGNSVENIGNSAFLSCKFIGDLIIPNSVTTLGTYAFGYCDKFTNLIIGNSLANIGDAAFYGCTDLTSITVNQTTPPTLLGSINSVFTMVPQTTPVYVPCGTVSNYVTNWGYFQNYYESPKDQGICGAQGNNLTWKLDCSGTLTISGSGDMEDYTYASLVGTAPWWNYRTQVTTLIIGDSVTHIGNYAFYLCSFTGSLNIPDSVKSIGIRAFYGCNGFTGDLIIPDSVTSVGVYAFANCSNFTSLTISNSLTTIEDGTFIGCTDLTGNVIIPTSVTSIGDNAFADCSSLDTITCNAIIPPTLGYTVFDNVPNTIPVYVLCNSLSDFQTDWGYFTNYIGTGLMGQGICGAQGNNLTWQLDCSGTLTISGSGDMEDYTYQMAPWYDYISQITTLIIGDSVTSIGDYAFVDGSNLTGNLIISDSVITIGDYAFYQCNGFNGSLTIGSSVISIGDRAFSGCSGFIGDLIIPDSVITIGEFAFSSCLGLTGLAIGNAVTTIDNNAFYFCVGLTGNLIIPNSVTTIGDGAFYGCSQLTDNLIIPNLVTNIGMIAFSDCSGFTSVTIGNSVTTIGSSAFENCIGLQTINFNAINCTTMGSLIQPVFANCIALTTLNIGNNVTNIPDFAFKDCNNLTGNLVIPTSVTSIGNNAFEDCNSLDTITCNAIIPPTLGTDAFLNVPQNIPVYVPCAAVSDYQTNWNYFNNFQPTGNIPTPTGLTVTQQSTTLKLTWQSTAATSYEIYRNSTSLGTVTTNAYTDNSALTDGTQYCYEIKAIDGYCESQLTDAECATYIASASNDATLINITVSKGTLTPAFISTTLIYTVDVADTVSSITINAMANNPLATIVGDGNKTLNVGQNSFPITVTAEDGTTTLTYSVTVTRNTTIAIGNYELEIGNLQVYPNPTNGFITITAVGAGFTAAQNGASIQIYDITGRIVQTQFIASQRNANEKNITIDISHLQQGMYYLKIGNETVKIIKE